MTTLVIGLTLLCILGLSMWTGYTYFFASSPELTPDSSIPQYYTNQANDITAQISKFELYKISFDENNLSTGKSDPFASQ